MQTEAASVPGPTVTGPRQARQSALALRSLIGNTPMIPLHFELEGVTLHTKCEFLNPSGSIKDRFAAAVIADAEERGLLNPDSIMLECTSGNTGIALARGGAAHGYKGRHPDE